jgi:sulfatase maturation enzyme AslB (radical SAM superfamily)
MPRINLRDQLKFRKTFCPLPFISYHTDVANQRKLCCISNNVVSEERITEIRSDLLVDKEVIECTQCYDKESLNLISHRQTQLKDWLKHKDDIFDAIESHDNRISPSYVDYDLRYSNLCNLECQTCNSKFSSSIAQREGKINIFLQYEPDLSINKLVKRIYLAGGEPFLIKSFSRLLNQIENTNCEIIINTNATVLTESMLSALDRFNNINFTVSIDGFGELNDKIRKNSHWEDIEANLKILAERYNGYSGMLINTVVQKDNVNHLLEIGKWIESKQITLWRLTLLTKPEKFHFSLNNNIQVPDELFKLSVVHFNLENTRVLQHITNYAKN